MSENYYEILGVSENATPEKIKKTYRELSLKYHPDRNGNNQENLSKYQKINEAYETLGDEEKKREYDMRKNNPFLKMSNMNGNSGEFTNVDEIFNSLFGNAFGPIMGGGPGFFMHQGMPAGMHGMPNIRIFRNGVQVNPFQQALEKPTPIIKNITITMEQVLNGGNIPVDIERWLIENGNKVFEHETVYIPIPKGIDDNEIIILRDKGNINEGNIIGDVKIFIKIENTTEFKRQGLDLILEKKISLKEALCGFSFELKYINGKSYTINNNGGNIITPSYQKIIPNMGLKREEHIGNLIIIFEIIFPTNLNSEKIEKLKELL